MTSIPADKYVLDPLGDVGVRALESQIQRPIPEPLRELLSQVGFLQNAIGGDWPSDGDEFVRLQALVPNDCVAFLADGAGNYHVVTSAGDLAFWDHETHRLEADTQSFSSFIGDLLRPQEPLESLAWQTQCSFRPSSEAVLLEALHIHAGVLVTGDWQPDSTSAAGVTTYVLPIQENHGARHISKQSYPSWSGDIYYLNRCIAIEEIGESQELYAHFRGMSTLGFKLVDYGILPKHLGNEI